VKFDIFYQLPEAANQVTTDRYRELIAEAAEADRLGPDEQPARKRSVRLGHVDDVHHILASRQRRAHESPRE